MVFTADGLNEKKIMKRKTKSAAAEAGIPQQRHGIRINHFLICREEATKE